MLSLAAVALLWRLHEPERPAAPPRHPVLEIKDGAQFVWRQPFLQPALMTGVVWNIAWFVLQAAYVPYAVRVLGLSAQMVGITLGAYGVGMVVGAMLASRLVGAMRFGRAIQLGPVVSVLAATSFFLFGVGPIIWTITSTTLRQSLTPEAMLGRVSSVFLAVNAGSRPIGAALGGIVGAQWCEAACLWLALAGFGLQAWLIVDSSLQRLDVLPGAPTPP